jgi:AraC-like DNA-binding protein
MLNPSLPWRDQQGGHCSEGERVTNPQAASLHFTTDAFRPSERVAAWREIWGKMVDLEIEAAAPDDPYFAEARIRVHEGLGIASTQQAQTRFVHPPSLINSDDILLCGLESGSWCGTHLGREAHLAPGEAVLGWSGETLNGVCEGSAWVIRVPAAAIAPMVGDLHAGMHRTIAASNGTLRLLRPYVRTLLDCSIPPALQRVAVTHVCDLIALLCGASGEAAALAADRGGRAARLRAIKQDIVGNLEHGDVSLEAIARRHRVSARTVQKLFDHAGATFSEYVLEQRLALARRLLADPRQRREKIASVAFAAGFGDLSYFYRAFRRRYDELPTDVRAKIGAPH